MTPRAPALYSVVLRVLCRSSRTDRAAASVQFATPVALSEV